MLQYLDSREINNNKEVEPLEKKKSFLYVTFVLHCTPCHYPNNPVQVIKSHKKSQTRIHPTNLFPVSVQ